MKCAVVVFPGSNCDSDCWHVLNDVVKTKVEYVWHKGTSLPNVDLVVLPGGFSYGDYLRTGAIARFSPIMNAVVKHAKSGKLVIGICNGFQILLEVGLLPGAMLRNRSIRFVCKHVYLKTENNKTAFTNRLSQNEILRIPIAHGEGNYFCDEKTLEELECKKRIVFRYASETGELKDEFNPNGSLSHIAGIMNEEGNVLGMMPHPERASETILSSDDGRKIWESILNGLK
ncbi:MAG: phosphoribosylformylglycinamidine synthase subunit PurQ [Candidatus Omnitrophica bacterium]|nr:phosphoribosylformylglycinamidine synthase subunit PurQ [Candidatus Omnitrophota bacterium]